MNKTAIIMCALFFLMILFLVMALLTNDVLTGNLMASFGIITGAFISHQFSELNKQ